MDDWDAAWQSGPPAKDWGVPPEGGPSTRACRQNSGDPAPAAGRTSAGRTTAGPRAAEPAELRRLESRIRRMAAEMAATTCEWLHLLEQFDRAEGWAGHGLLSCAHWLSWTCSISPGTARSYLKVAHALPALPLIDAAFAAGKLSYSKVRAMVRVADRVDEHVLLEQAMVQTVSQLERTVRQFRRLDGDGLAQQRRRRATWHWDDDGMLVVSARLPADEGALLVAALEQMRNDHDGRSELPGCPDGLAGTGANPPVIGADVDAMAFSGADSLVALAEKALAAGDVDSSGDDRHLLVLHADLALLSEPEVSARPDSAPGRHAWRRTAALPGSVVAQRCHLENGPGVDRETARRIACDAALVAILHHVGEGEPLRLGRKTRAISPAQRRALRVRDGGCQFPGCPRRRFLDAHHVQHWSQLGPTDLDNLVLVCRFHHMLVHEGGYRVAAHRDGGWVFQDPHGEVIPRAPGLVPIDRSGRPAGDLPACPADASSVGPPSTTPADPYAAGHPDDLLPGWAGEPFHLWATVAALQDNPRAASTATAAPDAA